MEEVVKKLDDLQNQICALNDDAGAMSDEAAAYSTLASIEKDLSKRQSLYDLRARAYDKRSRIYDARSKLYVERGKLYALRAQLYGKRYKGLAAAGLNDSSSTPQGLVVKQEPWGTSVELHNGNKIGTIHNFFGSTPIRVQVQGSSNSIGSVVFDSNAQHHHLSPDGFSTSSTEGQIQLGPWTVQQTSNDDGNNNDDDSEYEQPGPDAFKEPVKKPLTDKSKDVLLNDDESEEEGCVVCLTNRAFIMPLHCGHKVLCHSCTEELVNKSASLECPLCRTEFQSDEIIVCTK